MEIKRISGKCRCGVTHSAPVDTRACPTGAMAYYVGDHYLGVVGLDGSQYGWFKHCDCGRKVWRAGKAR